MKTRFTYADDDSESTLQEIVRYARKSRVVNNMKRKGPEFRMADTESDPKEKEMFSNVLKWIEKSCFSNPPTPELLAPPPDQPFVVQTQNFPNDCPPYLMKNQQSRQSRVLPMTPMYETSSLCRSSRMVTRPNSTQHEFQRNVVDRLPNTLNTHFMGQKRTFPVENEDDDHGTKMVYLYDSKNNHVYAEYGSFEHYFHIANGRIGEEPTYTEVQRRCDNYLFNGQQSYNSHSNAQYKPNQKPKMKRRVNGHSMLRKNIQSNRKHRDIHRRKSSLSFDNSRYDNKKVRKQKGNRESCQKIHHVESSANPYDKYSYSSSIPNMGEEKLIYVPKISSAEKETIPNEEQQISQEIAERFSRLYWNVTDRNGSGSIASKDNFHTRYFGRAGHSIVNMNSSSNDTQYYSIADQSNHQHVTSPENVIRNDRIDRAREAFKSGVGHKVFDDCYDLQGPSNRSAYKSHCEFYDLKVHNKVIPTVLPNNINDDYWKTPKKYRHKFHDIF